MIHAMKPGKDIKLNHHIIERKLIFCNLRMQIYITDQLATAATAKIIPAK